MSLQPNRCPTCGGKFGMTRQYWFRMSFCKLVCKEAYVSKIYKPPDQLEAVFRKLPDTMAAN